MEQETQSAFMALQLAKSSQIHMRPHRALTPLKVTPWLLAQAVLLPVALCALVLWSKPWLLAFWMLCLDFWSARLGLVDIGNMAIESTGRVAFQISAGDAALTQTASNTPLPSAMTLWVTLAVTLVGLWVSLHMKKASFPLKYPLRIVCAVLLVSLAYFGFWASYFPYTIARHSVELLTIGYVVMLATPVMLAMGYYILNQSLVKKLAYTLLIWLFFAIMVPHQVLVQALLMQHGSVLFMPVLYLCFGAVFDAMVFVALYSWAASNAPAKATV